MALDKQISIYSIGTEHFYSNPEKALHQKNCKLRFERNQLKDKLKEIVSKIETMSEQDQQISESTFSDQYIDNLIQIAKREIKNNRTIPIINDPNDPFITLLLQHRFYTNILKDKRFKIKESKQQLLDLLQRKFELNHETGGKHHTRTVNTDLDIRDVVNIFDSSVTRLEPIDSYELSDNLLIVQIYFFDVFKDIFYHGFQFHGEEYQYFTSSAGQIRTKKAVFIKKSFYERHEKTLMCGLTLDQINAKGGNNPNKHLAYMALTNSATDEWSDFDIDRTIVVDDFETEVSGLFDFVDDETYEIKRVNNYVPIPHTDGAGMILPKASKYNFMVRLPWIKGLLGSFDYVKFIEEKHCSPIIKDIYGKEYNIIDDDIQIIFTKSQFKLWKYYDSWDQYKEFFKQYNCKAGICNDERATENMRIGNANINYQMLQTLTDITDKELEEIADKTIYQINNLCSNVKNLQKAFHVQPSNHHMTYLQQAIQIYPDIINDDYLKQSLREIKNSMVKNAKAGKLNLKAKYTFLLPDFYAFCEWLFLGIETPEGLLQDHEVYCRLFDDSPKLDCLRSPHLYKEHAIRKNKAYRGDTSKDYKKFEQWFDTDGIYTSTHDLISKILQFDVDGDRSLVVADQTFVNVAERNMKDIVPLYYNMKKAQPVQLTKDTMYKGLTDAFTGGNIGIYSNNISKIWNSEIFTEGSPEEQQEAIDTVKLLCMENNFVIDYAKTLYKPTRPEVIRRQIISHTKKNLPHFFIYAKDKELHQVDDKTSSIVNRLDDMIPNPRIDLRKAGLKSPDYHLFMNDPEIPVDLKVVERYLELNKFYKYKINLKDEYDSKISYIAKFIKQDMSKFPYPEEVIADMLAKYLYSRKKCEAKSVLWFCYGKYLIKNLRRNLNQENKEKQIKIQCQDCKEWFYTLDTTHVKRCSYCQKKADAINHSKAQMRYQKRAENELIVSKKKRDLRTIKGWKKP